MSAAKPVAGSLFDPSPHRPRSWRRGTPRLRSAAQAPSPHFSRLFEIGHEASRWGSGRPAQGANGGLDTGDDVRAAPESVG